MPRNRVKKPLGPRKVCPYCNYGAGGDDGVWHARVPSPKECPRCKRYLRAGAKDYIEPLKVESPDYTKMISPPPSGSVTAALCDSFGVKFPKKP